ncbi:hypothetical protein ABPG75_010730 [Micractinium tetrahymenae]
MPLLLLPQGNKICYQVWNEQPTAATAAAAAAAEPADRPHDSAAEGGQQGPGQQHLPAGSPGDGVLATQLLLGRRAAAGAAASQPRRLLIISGLGIPHGGGYVRMLAEHLASLREGDRQAPLLTVCAYDLRFASLLLCGVAQGWQVALAALARRPLVSAAMLAGQLPGLHALATWALLHHLFSDEWLRAPAGSNAGQSRLRVMLARSGEPGRPNLLQDNSMHSTARLGQALACARHRLTAAEAEAIRRASVRVHLLTGSWDGLTPALAVRWLAGSLGAQVTCLHGAHAGILVEHAEQVLAAAEQAVLGRVVSSAKQRVLARKRAESALLDSSYAYWEHILWLWSWALLAACCRLLRRCMRRLHGGGCAGRAGH